MAMMRRHSSIDDMSILLYTYRQRTYLRLPSITSMNWSIVQSSRKTTSAHTMRYSFRMRPTISRSMPFVCGTIAW